MQHKKQAVWLLTLAALSLSGIARAEEASKGSQSFWDKTKVMGQFNTIYSWNFNNPPVGTPATTLTGTLPTPVTAGAPVPVAGALPTGNNALRVFDYRANEFGVNLVDLALENTPNDWAKFRLDLNFGKDVAVVDATKGGVIGVDEIGLQQAYAEFIAPIGKGLTIRAGHFVTLLGYEVIESASNWNTSRSFLFGFAIPFTHTGILATYPVSDQVSASLGIVNGWDLTGDNNKGKTALAQLVYKPTDKITLSAQGTVGPEQGLNNGNVRGIIDFVGTWNVTDQFTLGFNYDWAHEQGGAAVGAAGTGTGTGGACSGMTCWQGVAGYAHYKPFDFVGVSLRGEFFHDDGVRLGAFAGVNANIAEGTGTLHFYLADGLETRLEFRHDYANQSVFTRGSGTTRRFQDTASAEVVYSF